MRLYIYKQMYYGKTISSFDVVELPGTIKDLSYYSGEN